MITAAKTTNANGGTTNRYEWAWNHEVDVASSLLLVYTVHAIQVGIVTPQLDSVTFNEVAMEVIGESWYSNLYRSTRLALWMLKNPAVGTHEVKMSYNANYCRMSGISTTFFGTHNDDPIYDVVDDQTRTSAIKSSTLNTVAGGAVVSACVSQTQDDEYPVVVKLYGTNDYVYLGDSGWTPAVKMRTAYDNTIETPSHVVAWSTTEYGDYVTNLVSACLRPKNANTPAPLAVWL
jgi:hypothetical protein